MLDAQVQFSNLQAITVTAISTNVYDTVATASKNIGGIAALFFVVRVGTAFTAGGAGTLDASLVSSSTADLATAPTAHTGTGVKALAALTANTTICIKALPFGDYAEYIGVQYTVATGPMTAGTVDAFLTRDPSFWKGHTLPAYNPAA